MRLEFEIITPMRVPSSMLIGEVFPIEVSDDLLHSLGSFQKVNPYAERVITGARVLRSLYAIRISNDHSNACTK